MFLLWGARAASSTLHAAQAADHDALVAQIEARYVSMMCVAADSPIVKATRAAAMAVDPGVDPQTWASVSADTAAGMVRLFTSKGSSLDLLIRSALEPFSDKDLLALGKVLARAAFMKFQVAMSSPASQQQLLSGTAKEVLNLGPWSTAFWRATTATQRNAPCRSLGGCRSSAGPATGAAGQQHQNGAGAAVDFPGAGEREHRVDALQVGIDQDLQHRAAIAGAQALAVHDSQHTPVVLQGVGQEGTQCASACGTISPCRSSSASTR